MRRVVDDVHALTALHDDERRLRFRLRVCLIVADRATSADEALALRGNRRVSDATAERSLTLDKPVLLRPGRSNLHFLIRQRIIGPPDGGLNVIEVQACVAPSSSAAFAYRNARTASRTSQVLSIDRAPFIADLAVCKASGATPV